jgi:hypothetical protein
MSDPIFVLGCHRSGTSVVAGLLYHACGVSMGELMPPTEDNPLGYFEAIGVVDAHRGLLAQLERDWTCPPSSFRPDLMNLSALSEQVEIHTSLPGVWAMKDPRSMFLLPAWSHLGVDRVRLVAVVRPPVDTVLSIEKRDNIRQDRAEAIVDTYLQRLAEISEQVPLPVIHFPGDGDGLIKQVRDLAASLELPWDETAARDFFNEDLVRYRSPMRDSGPVYQRLIESARFPEKVPVISLKSLNLNSEPEWPLETHLGVRFVQQRSQLWEFSRFSGDGKPEVVEVLPEGARVGGGRRPGITLHQIEATSPLTVGSTLMREGLRPQGLVVPGLLAGRSSTDIEFFFRSMYISSHPLAELAIDTPDPTGAALLSASPTAIDQPRPELVREVAEECGWDHVSDKRLSAGRTGLFFRKRVSIDTELIPVVADLLASIPRFHSVDQRLSVVEEHLGLRELTADRPGGRDEADAMGALEAERKRADEAERALYRLRHRRSVRLALALARPFQGLFRTVRTWKKRRLPEG